MLKINILHIGIGGGLILTLSTALLLFLDEIDELSPLGLSLFRLMIGLIFYFPLLVVDLALLPPWLFMAKFLDIFDEVSWFFLMERLVPF